MSEFNGVVQRINARNWGNKIFYSFTLSGKDGWYNTGAKKPPAEGSSVSFEAEPNSKGFLEVDTKTIQYQKDGEPSNAAVAPVVSAQAAKSQPKTTQEKGFWDRKEEREVHNDAARELGASRNTAISIVDLLLKYEAVKLPAAQAKKADVIWETIQFYTEKLMGKEKQSEQPVEAESEIVEDENWS